MNMAKDIEIWNRKNALPDNFVKNPPSVSKEKGD